jgi:hypothetical protein
LFSPRTARRVFICTLLFLVLTQTALLCKFRNGLSRFDGFDEADAVRAADAFNDGGFTRHHGLGQILYGNRFPNSGALIDHFDTNGAIKPEFLVGYPEPLRTQNEWVYMHYPPGPELICGVLEFLFGRERLWLWRLFPISLGLLAIIAFYRALATAFGPDRGSLVCAACAILPMTSTYMPGLHFESYSFVFLLLQLSILVRWFWVDGLRLWHLPALFLLGFFQGWVSFDIFFVLSLSAAPLWLMRRAEGAQSSWRDLFLTVAVPFGGFCAAQLLHLLQLAGELDGLRQALDELTRTALARAGQVAANEHFAYFKVLLRVTFLYIREFLRLYNQHFGPFMALAFGAAVFLLFRRHIRASFSSPEQQSQTFFYLEWLGPKPLWPSVFAAFVVCTLWPMAMPGATIGNFHIYPRDFFLFYFVVVLAIVKSLGLNRAETDS